MYSPSLKVFLRSNVLAHWVEYPGWILNDLSNGMQVYLRRCTIDFVVDNVPSHGFKSKADYFTRHIHSDQNLIYWRILKIRNHSSTIPQHTTLKINLYISSFLLSEVVDKYAYFVVSLLFILTLNSVMV